MKRPRIGRGKQVRNRQLYHYLKLTAVEPLIIEMLWAETRVSAGALVALDDLPVVQTKI